MKKARKIEGKKGFRPDQRRDCAERKGVGLEASKRGVRSDERSIQIRPDKACAYTRLNGHARHDRQIDEPRGREEGGGDNVSRDVATRGGSANNY